MDWMNTLSIAVGIASAVLFVIGCSMVYDYFSGITRALKNQMEANRRYDEAYWDYRHKKNDAEKRGGY